MIQELDIANLFVVFRRRYPLSEFRAASKARPGSYADELVKRIYDCLFANPKDLFAEYQRYYAIEYPYFGQFLYWKYGVKANLAHDIEKIAVNGLYVGLGHDTIDMWSDDTFNSILRSILTELGEDLI